MAAIIFDNLLIIVIYTTWDYIRNVLRHGTWHIILATDLKERSPNNAAEADEAKIYFFLPKFNIYLNKHLFIIKKIINVVYYI